MIRPSFIKSDVERICAQFPNLYANGFYDTPQDSLLAEEFLEQINVCARLIAAHCAPAKRIRPESSYGLKSIVEKVAAKYVCDGAFIAAAILLGYEPTRGRNKYPSAHFKIRFSKALRDFMYGRVSALSLSGGASGSVIKSSL